MNKHLHIIAFDVPYPPNYGGAIDVFYRIKSLHEKGVRIILHCFVNDRPESPVLVDYCEQVYYYQRDLRFIKHLNRLPFSVVSRSHPELLNNLSKDDYPILFEGLMSSYYLSHPDLSHRKKFYREANIEHYYYYHLALATKSFSKKIYFIAEAFKLYFFQKKIANADLIVAISTTDTAYFKRMFPTIPVEFVPSFHANTQVTSVEGISDYILYHANLSVPENSKVAVYLINHVFSKLTHKSVVAGMNPPKHLRQLISQFDNIELVANPDETQMRDLVANAQIITLFTFQATGMKIKLLESLFRGRHIIVNKHMLQGSGLDALCFQADTPKQGVALCNQLMQIPFSQTEVVKRTNFLLPAYSNVHLSEIIISAMNAF